MQNCNIFNTTCWFTLMFTKSFLKCILCSSKIKCVKSPYGDICTNHLLLQLTVMNFNPVDEMLDFSPNSVVNRDQI